MSGKKILVVDDSKVAAMSVEMILRRGGPYEVSFAGDGAEAVAKAAEEQPDLILMDIVMPKMNGFEACRAIRSQENTAEIPIILVTTRGEESSVQNGYAAGCNDYVNKPIDSAELLKKIDSLVKA